MSKVEQIRKEFVEQLFNEICNVPSYSNFYSNTFNVVVKLGLQLKAKEEQLFETGDWEDLGKRDELLEKIKKFLIKYTK